MNAKGSVPLPLYLHKRKLYEKEISILIGMNILPIKECIFLAKQPNDDDSDDDGQELPLPIWKNVTAVRMCEPRLHLVVGLLNEHYWIRWAWEKTNLEGGLAVVVLVYTRERQGYILWGHCSFVYHSVFTIVLTMWF